MLMADTMEEGSGLFFEREGAEGGDDGDNLAISLDTLYEILDEDPSSSQTHSPTELQNCFHQGIVACAHADPEGEFQRASGLGSAAIPEDFRKVGLACWDSSNYMAAADYKVQRDIVFLSEHVGSSNNLSGVYNPSSVDNGNGNLHFSKHAELETFGSCPSNYSSELSSDSGKNSLYMDSVGGSFDTFMPDYFDQQQSQRSAGAGFGHMESAHFMNNFHFDSEQEKDPRQVGEEGSLHAMVMEKPGSNDELHNNPNMYVMPDFGVQEGNWYPSLLMCSSMNAGVTPAEADKTEVNPGDASYAAWDASNSCASLPRGSATDADDTLRQTFPSQHFQAFIPSREETVIPSMVEGKNQHLPSQKIQRSGEVKLATQQEFLNTFLQEASDPDMDTSFLEVPSTKFSQCQDMSFKSESSTDSSPIPLSRSSFISSDSYRSALNKPKYLVPDVKTIMLNRKDNSLLKDERKDQVLVPQNKEYDISKGIDNAAHKDSSKKTLIVDDDDDDVCILDDVSDPVHLYQAPVHIKHHPLPVLQRSGFSDPCYNGLAIARMRPKADDERLTFHIALQGLSQPTTEATPPDGVLAVALLRHQRIALSWMVLKETSSLNCSGGILADDQGLGKTVSTIALILTERSPSSMPCSVSEKQDGYEALNLDDDDDEEEGGDSEPKLMKQPRNGYPTVMDTPVKQENSVMAVKGRPAAGTLVVCPTSVLRQWADELQNKVTSKANLSFLVYHGSSRTKDPNELAKYDVVLTTYAIVSMEVPKQPLVDKEDEDKVKPGLSSVSMGHFSGKKRKNPANSSLKNSLLESAARPLAKVGWFRVILDEAQSIKNHRTQVARACWGLRAKRRWCLSGTPIQNAVDDLYSYFRFLRYDPYAVYKSFCTTIKMPINRNPTNGYKKLQAVLMSIMLRRTKGTLIDGKPIITLPPKTVTLKKVDFSLEERAFYSTLEAESREQFKEYAAAGTVKQNYVNILLMLLRLRQACDHPLLVKGYESNSTQRSSMEMANKLPRDKIIYLLSCLEACLAICAICNDPPEDAVVTVCGHVFCNQCISDRLTGDDNVCPSSQCKVQLTVASVFSRGTLKSSLAGLTGSDCCSGDSSPDGPDKPKLREDSMSSNSSKIKAAIEILQSLPRCQWPSPTSNFENSDYGPMESLKHGGNTVPMRCSNDTGDRKHSELEIGSITQITEKAIVFSQWTRMLDLLEVPLKDSCIQYRRLDGTMSVAAREKAVKDFNTLPEVTVMIMSLKAASLGLNMVAACHVLLLDLWWNPTTEDQAIDRAHRIGQTRPVTVSRLTVKDTVEDRILALQEKKREMVASAFGEDESGSRQTRLTEEDLKYLFMV